MMRVVTAVACLTLCACGSDDTEPRTGSGGLAGGGGTGATSSGGSGASGGSSGGTSGVGGSSTGGGGAGGSAGGGGSAGAGSDPCSVHAHEPTGMSVVGPGTNPMNALPPASPAKDAWGQIYYADQIDGLSLGDDPSAPFQPTTYYRVTYPQGFPGGGESPARWTLADWSAEGDQPVVYIATWMRHSPNFTNQDAVGTKLLFFFRETPQTNHYFTLLNGVGTDFAARVQNQGFNDQLVEEPIGEIISWHCYEWLLSAGDAGQANGQARLWKDGALVLERTDFPFVPAGENLNSKYLWMDPTYGGGGSPVEEDRSFDMAAVYVSVGD